MDVKTRIFFVPILSLLILGSCSLEEEILDEVDSNAVVNGASSLNVVAPVYAQLRQMAGAGPTPFVMSLHSSDEMMVPTRGGDWNDGGAWRLVHTHQWDATYGLNIAAWEMTETAVGCANTSLFLLGEFPENPEIEHLKLEMRLLRAYFRYIQVDLWRQFPLRDENDLDFDTPPPVLVGNEAVQWLIDELNDLIPQLNSLAEVPNPGRASREAAIALLAKIYLNAEVYTGTAQWENCLQQCNMLVNAGLFQLANDYFSTFLVDNRSNNREAILVARQGDALEFGRVFSGPTVTLHYQQTFGLSVFFLNGFNAVESFVRKWDQDGDPSNGVSTTDLRFRDDRIMPGTGTNLGFLIGPQFNPDGSPIILDGEQLSYKLESKLFDTENAGARVLKYQPDLSSTNFFLLGANDYMMLRYADVYLTRIEALFNLGDQAAALAELNALRLLRNVPPLTSITADAILDERGFELYWEGWRRQDLIRFGKFNDAWSEKGVSEPFKQVFPIPITAIEINPNLVQNEGY